jgi:hypothetical protein
MAIYNQYANQNVVVVVAPQQHTGTLTVYLVESPYLFPYLLSPTTNTATMAPIKRVKKVMTLPINVIFSHLQVRFGCSDF